MRNRLVQFLLQTKFFFGFWVLFSFQVTAQTFQYAKKMGCEKAGDRGSGIVVDKQGNQYTTGTFRSWNGIGPQAADFDPGPSFYPLWSYQGGNETFVSKLNTSGNFVWAKQFAGPGYNIGNAIATDAIGNIYISGNFSGEVDFNPGAGVFKLTSKGPLGMFDVFVVKLSPAGEFKWAKAMGGVQMEFNTALAVDKFGNVFTSGVFNGVADFDPGQDSTFLTCIDGGDAFLTKFDPNGNFIWARNMGGLGEYGSFAVDTAGSALVRCVTKAKNASSLKYV